MLSSSSAARQAKKPRSPQIPQSLVRRLAPVFRRSRQTARIAPGNLPCTQGRYARLDATKTRNCRIFASASCFSRICCIKVTNTTPARAKRAMRPCDEENPCRSMTKWNPWVVPDGAAEGWSTAAYRSGWRLRTVALRLASPGRRIGAEDEVERRIADPEPQLLADEMMAQVVLLDPAPERGQRPDRRMGDVMRPFVMEDRRRHAEHGRGGRGLARGPAQPARR